MEPAGKTRANFYSAVFFLLIGEVLKSVQYTGIFIVVISLIVYQYISRVKINSSALPVVGGPR